MWFSCSDSTGLQNCKKNLTYEIYFLHRISNFLLVISYNTICGLSFHWSFQQYHIIWGLFIGSLTCSLLKVIQHNYFSGFLSLATSVSFDVAGGSHYVKRSCHPQFCVTLHISVIRVFHYVCCKGKAGIPEAGNGKDRDGN